MAALRGTLAVQKILIARVFHGFRVGADTA